MAPEIQRAKAILQATRTLRFDADLSVDLRDRLGVLTVVVGLREVAAFGFAERDNEGGLRTLKDVLNKHGLPTQVTRQVQPTPHHRSLNISPELAAVFDRIDAESCEKHTGRLLWVCRNPKTREQIKRAVGGEIPTGTLLGYPKCCVEQDRRDKALCGEAFCKAILDATTHDASALERGLREDLQVPLVLDSPPTGDIAATDERFPFVQHIACRACLSLDDSPTARLNMKYEQLARDVDPALHTALIEIANVTVRIGQIVDDVERKGLTRETVDVQTNQELQRLFRDQERIHDNFFANLLKISSARKL